ncbi:putative manganese transporter [Faecalimicrobium sp. JNUCC 81]
MEIFMSSAEEAFLHVGSMIGFFIVLFGYINYKTNENFTYIITKNKKLQPLIGALIGAIPGCGGSLAIIPLYIQGKLSFGAIVASLIASMGDAAFILISANFKVYLIVTIVGLITGILTGYIVDIFNLEIKLNLRKKQVSTLTRGTSCACNHGLSNNRENVKNQNSKIYKFAYLMTHKVGYKIYLLILLVGFAFMTIAHSGIENEIIHSIHELEEVLAVLGILSSIIYTMCFKVVSNNYNIDKDDRSSLKNILINGVAEISFIITWIFIAYLGYDFVVMLVGGEEYIANLVLYTGIGSVFIGALLGLIPGCGVQILLMSFYLKGNLPLGAVIANSISQDGDALFPIIALDKKSALWASIITTIPAILVGIIVYIITV